jgi:membrane protease YdiL (CAAX protease family)
MPACRTGRALPQEGLGVKDPRGAPANTSEVVPQIAWGGRLLSGPPAYRPATPWQAGPALLTTAIIVAGGFAAGMLVALYLSAVLGRQLPVHRLWVLATLQVATISFTLLACRLFGGRVPDVLALRGAATGWRAYAGAILAMAMLQSLLAGAQHLFFGHDLLTDLRPFVDLVTGPHWPLAASVLAVGAPLSEELLFRGFLLSALAQSRLGFAGAALVSTAAWSALHFGYSPMGLAEVFAIGLFLCWLLWRTGSLWVTIFCHAVYNGAIVLALLLVKLPA